MRRRALSILCGITLAIAACSEDADDQDDGTSSDPATDTEAATDTDPTGATDQTPPQGADAIEAWIASGAYLGWAAESAVHASTGPHGSGVRTFVNAATLGSLEAGNTEHPVGAALVKELYAGGEIDGYAVMLKVASGQGGDGWYWYERMGSSVVADDVGVGLCTGCHGAGVDLVRTPFPLQ